MVQSYYEQVTVLDDSRAEIFPIGINGLIEEDLKELRKLVPKLKSGELDAVSLVPIRGVVVTEKLREIVDSQLKDVMEGSDLKGSPSMTRKGGGYTGLHTDGLFDVDGIEIHEPGIRMHFTQGSSRRDSNVPAGYLLSDFDPYFLIGRVPVEVESPEGAFLPFNEFRPVVAIDVQSPIWTVFRNLGDRSGLNPPLAHCVVPKKVLDAILHPQVQWSGIDHQGNQTAIFGEDKVTVTSDNYSFIAGVESAIKSPDREFTARDFIDVNVKPMEL